MYKNLPYSFTDFITLQTHRMADNNPDSLNLSEEDNGTPEQFNEAVSAAGRQAGSAVKTATKKDPKKANLF